MIVRAGDEIRFKDVGVYEARSNFWAGETLKKISGGESLYLKTSEEIMWGFTIHCNPKDDHKPHTVSFENGNVWGVASMNDYKSNIEWPLFLKEIGSSKKLIARVHRIFSDSISLDIFTDSACLCDILIWHHIASLQ